MTGSSFRLYYTSLPYLFASLLRFYPSQASSLPVLGLGWDTNSHGNLSVSAPASGRDEFHLQTASVSVPANPFVRRVAHSPREKTIV